MRGRLCLFLIRAGTLGGIQRPGNRHALHHGHSPECPRRPGGVAGVNVVAQAELMAGIEGVAETDLAQNVALLVVVAAPG